MLQHKDRPITKQTKDPKNRSSRTKPISPYYLYNALGSSRHPNDQHAVQKKNGIQYLANTPGRVVAAKPICRAYCTKEQPRPTTKLGPRLTETLKDTEKGTGTLSSSVSNHHHQKQAPRSAEKPQPFTLGATHAAHGAGYLNLQGQGLNLTGSMNVLQAPCPQLDPESHA